MKNYFNTFILVSTLFIVGLACKLPGLITSTATLEPKSDQDISAVEPVLSDTFSPIPETENSEPTPPKPPDIESEPPAEPTAIPTNAGQIAYISNGNVWRYIVDTNQVLQVTTDGVAGDYLNTYRRARFSPDGSLLAYIRGKTSFILDLVSNTLIDISAHGEFFEWQGEGTLFYTARGDFECPPIEDLDDQYLINFDILRMDLNNLSNPEFLANIGGGLKYLASISPDGQWAGIIACGCYSECGGANLYNLITHTPITAPFNINPDGFSFSSDGTRFVTSEWQLFGYTQSPLYVADSNFSEITEVFSMSNVSPNNRRWSPNDDWIGFTGIVFAGDEMVDTDRCVRLVRPDGSENIALTCGFANFITWAPDGTKLLYSQTNGAQETFFLYDLTAGIATPLPFQIDPYSQNSVDWGLLQ